MLRVKGKVSEFQVMFFKISCILTTSGPFSNIFIKSRDTPCRDVDTFLKTGGRNVKSMRQIKHFTPFALDFPNSRVGSAHPGPPGNYGSGNTSKLK